MNVLEIPKSAQSDPAATECIRAWIAHETLHVSLLPEIFEDPAAWGIVLADIARHLANSFHGTGGADPRDTYRQIAEAFGNSEIE